MASELGTTPISRDDSSRLVQPLRLVADRLEAISMAAIYARRAEGEPYRSFWVEACGKLREADSLIGGVIGRWRGRYVAWGVDGPHPTVAGVQLGVARMRVGLRTIADQLDRRYVLADGVTEDVEAAMVALRDACRLMLPAWRDSGGRPATRDEWDAREAARMPGRWQDQPAGSPAALTAAAMRSRTG